jgi:hypothetical protein
VGEIGEDELRLQHLRGAGNRHLGIAVLARAQARPGGQIAELVDQYAALAYAPTKFTPGVTPIPPSGKLLDGAELKLMVEASLDGWLTTGRFKFNRGDGICNCWYFL